AVRPARRGPTRRDRRRSDGPALFRGWADCRGAGRARSMRDALLVARFEMLRALRTWRALALLVLYAVAAAGAAWLFAEFVGMLENTVADQLGVARTEPPGAMLDTLVASDTWRDFVGELVGSEHLVEHVLRIPPLAMFDLWFSFLVVPFFAASAAAE